MTVPAIAHCTDLTGDDPAGFHHAAALAAASGARLVTIHGNPASSEVARLPDAAPLARRWGRPIEHQRLCHECCDDVADTVIDAIRQVAPGLVVAGTHARHGLAALLSGSVAEAVARNITAPILIVPNHVRGFVDPGQPDRARRARCQLPGPVRSHPAGRIVATEPRSRPCTIAATPSRARSSTPPSPTRSAGPGPRSPRRASGC